MIPSIRVPMNIFADRLNDAAVRTFLLLPTSWQMRHLHERCYSRNRWTPFFFFFLQVSLPFQKPPSPATARTNERARQTVAKPALSDTRASPRVSHSLEDFFRGLLADTQSEPNRKLRYFWGVAFTDYGSVLLTYGLVLLEP